METKMKTLELTEEEIRLLYDAVYRMLSRYFEVASAGSRWLLEDRKYFEQRYRKYKDLRNKLRESLPKKKGDRDAVE